MVGVPRSKGCLICVKQRVKCDQTKPSCHRCTRLGLQCPGYSKQPKFVYEIPRAENAKDVGQGSFHHVRDLARPGSKAQDRFPDLSPRETSGSGTQRVPRGVIEATYHDMQTLTIFIQNSTPLDKCTNVHFTKKWLCCIPSQIGTSDVLDDAVRCLANYYVGNISGSEKALKRGQRAYGNALLSLQKAVADPVRGMASETLCATMVMSLYEQFACTQKHSWINHAGGASKLIQIRGPARQRSEFDRIMLFAFRAQWIMEAFMHGTASVLDDPIWHSYFEEAEAQQASNQLVTLCSEFFKYLVKCPGLTQESRVLRRDHMEGRSDKNKALDFLNRVRQLSSKLRDWYRRFCNITGPQKEIPSRTKDAKFPLVYQYDGSFNIFYPTCYYGCQILLNSFINMFQTNSMLEAEMQSMVTQVCKSVEYAYQAGVFGPVEMVFGLRMAFMAADVPTKIWIKDHMEKMASIMPVMQHQVSMEAKVVVLHDP